MQSTICLKSTSSHNRREDARREDNLTCFRRERFVQPIPVQLGWYSLYIAAISITMADEGKLQKMEVDYTSTVDEKLPEVEKLAKVM